MGAVTASLPITGVPLPLVSFGGSSLVISLVAMGILTNIAVPVKPRGFGPPSRAAEGRDQSRSEMNVVIAGGGTAGHVNPAIALARALGSDQVTFVGTSAGIEATHGPRGRIRARRHRGCRLRPVPSGPASAGCGARVESGKDACTILARRAPSVVVGMGGYVSLPVVSAARSRSVPVVLHEQNIVLGLANRVARRFARTVAVSFEETLDTAGPRAVHVGNPVLPEIAHLDRGGRSPAGLRAVRSRPCTAHGDRLRRESRSEDIERGRSPNRSSPGATAATLQVLHISGRSSEVGVPGSLPNYVRIDHTDAMHEVYAVADVAICRGGATTVAELTVTGTPSIIVPYPYHRDRQQEKHGLLLRSAGAAEVVADPDASGDRLGSIVDGLLSDDRLTGMARAARSLGRPDAAEHLATVVREAA